MTVDFQGEVLVDGIIKDAKILSTKSAELATDTRLLMGQMKSLQELITMYFEAKDWYAEVSDVLSDMLNIWDMLTDTETVRSKQYRECVKINAEALREYTIACTMLRRIGIPIQEDF